MTYKEYLALAFALGFLAHFYWGLYVAYPMVIDTSIKKGKSWLYLPLRWKGFRKKLIKFLSLPLNLVILCLGVVTLWVYLNTISLPVFAVSALVLLGVHFIAANFSKKRRFIQQEDSYFFIRGQVQTSMATQGKALTENEVSSLASFQHQNLLREADQQGKLNKALIQQSFLAKTHKSKKREKSVS